MTRDAGGGARFDDLGAGRALRFDPPDEVLVATRPDEVAGVLAEIDAATAAGAWAHGHLAYEAASGLDRVDGVLDLAADPDLAGLYADLAHARRGAHHALLDEGRFVVVSASPERFVRRTGDTPTVRPMKGTAARGRTTAEDRAIAARLRASSLRGWRAALVVDKR